MDDVHIPYYYVSCDALPRSYNHRSGLIVSGGTRSEGYASVESERSLETIQQIVA